jgi:putative ABC transport system permease protein
MRTRDLIPLSVKALVVNKNRSLLTMLGIVIGIGSVILMISVGQAAQRYLLDQVASFGSDQVYIESGKGDSTESGPPTTIIKQVLTLNDFKKLKSLPWVKGVDAMVITSDIVSYGGSDNFTTIGGASPDEVVLYNESLTKGIFFSQEDLDAHAHVVVLGYKLADTLFGQETPLGRTIKIAKQPFRVIGVLAPIGTRFFQDADKQAFIPFTALFDVYNKDRINFIAVKSGDTPIKTAKDQIRIAIRETHNIDNPTGDLSKDDFLVSSQEDAIQQIAIIGTILQILLASIASISLVVAGVGIMNIMYVTVTERTREIGLRKALGAKRHDILGQFLAEAVFLTVVAGIIGVIFGIALSWIAILIIQHYDSNGWSFAVPWIGAEIGFGTSVLVGVIFGYFPALRAANLHPIEALRYE